MNTSIVLAQALGIIFTILGLSMILNKKVMAAVAAEMMQNKSSLWIGGLVTLILGTVIVTLNNAWTSGLPFYLAIIGWLTLIKGALILLFPTTAVSYYKKMNKEHVFAWAGVIALILGLALLIQ